MTNKKFYLFVFCGIGLIGVSSYFFYPIALMILHHTVGGVFTEMLHEIASHTVLFVQVIFFLIFFIPGIWLLKKGIDKTRV
ncbi:hypothetical protein [Nitrosopumilus sp. Nsub]|uniref:hypothetical protein n=1 Tax=Nitrosopumilus sp. Nsub TaxID=1776294 RepID=UPI00083654FD|nr:hypothetical protein [Nitrosopumilus sp. Nsub]